MLNIWNFPNIFEYYMFCRELYLIALKCLKIYRDYNIEIGHFGFGSNILDYQVVTHRVAIIQ